jgi:hypothetical protein
MPLKGKHGYQIERKTGADLHVIFSELEDICGCGGTGIRSRLKICGAAKPVGVQISPAAPFGSTFKPNL